jgi:hypothetical protein
VELATAAEGQLVVKAVYLPRRSASSLSDGAAATEEISSVRLGPTGDPVYQAQQHGTVLLTVQLGNIDLENPDSPPPGAPPATPDVPPDGPKVAPLPRAVSVLE